MSHVNSNHKSIFWKRFSPFAYLNATQFLLTLNDSIFRLLVTYSLINKLGKAASSSIISISGILFVAPFLIFSMPAGEMADKFSKQKIIFWSLIAEVVVMLYGIFAMYSQSTTNAFIAIFLVAWQSSVFNPAKYSIIPEIVPQDKISKVNGYLTLATYLAIILGTFLASLITDITGGNYTLIAIFCFVIALIGLYTSMQITKTPVRNSTKKINPLFFIQVFKSCKLASKYPHLLLVILSAAYFSYTASFTYFNLVPFGFQALHIQDYQTGYIFLAAGLGLALGALTVAKASGKNVELSISIWGAIGTTVSYFIIYAFCHNILIVTLIIFSIGLHGGLFIVPLDAYIQVASPDKDRGEIVAAAAFVAFSAVMLASLSIGFFSNVLHLTAAEGFLVIAATTLIVTVIFTFCLPEYLTRLIAVSIFRFLFHIESASKPELNFYEGSLLISEQATKTFRMGLIQFYPRISFIRFFKKQPSQFFKPWYNILHLTPIGLELSEEELNKKLQKLNDKKIPLCLFLKDKLYVKEEEKIKTLLEKILEANPHPIVLGKIRKNHKMTSKRSIFNLFKRLPLEVKAYFSEKKQDKMNLEQAKLALKELPISS